MWNIEIFFPQSNYFGNDSPENIKKASMQMM
jgi:hypothetical protein